MARRPLPAHQVLILLALGLCAVLPAGCQTTDETADRLAQFFVEAAFPSQISNNPGRTPPGRNCLSRWTGTVRAAATGPRGDKRAERIAARVAAFGALAGIETAWQGGDVANADLTVRVEESLGTVNRVVYHATCYARPRPRGDCGVGSVEIVIPDIGDSVFDDCLDHELMHAFGFQGHSHRVRSVLSGAHGEGALTEWDRIAIRTLYDPGLSLGMPREEALARARPIIARHLAAGGN